MMDFIIKYIMPIFLVILLTLAIVIIGMFIYKEIQLNNYFDKKDYIQNLEEKLNILTLDYENFVVEDSKNQ